MEHTRETATFSTALRVLDLCSNNSVFCELCYDCQTLLSANTPQTTETPTSIKQQTRNARARALTSCFSLQSSSRSHLLEPAHNMSYSNPDLTTLANLPHKDGYGDASSAKVTALPAAAAAG